MISRRITCASIVLISAWLSLCGLATAQSAWNGTWHLDVARSSGVAKEGAPEAYRFSISSDERIVWEIPSLGEVVRGRVGGRPMSIHRNEPTTGLALSVKRDGNWGLRYTVYRNGRVDGGGRMMLVDDANAWVDLTWVGQHTHPGPYLVYVKEKSGEIVDHLSDLKRK